MPDSPLPLHPNAVAVVAAAANAGLTIVPIEYPDGTRTAADAAAAIGCVEAQIVKSLIFGVTGSDELLLALVSGANRLDERRLADAAGVPGTRRADADAVRVATGFPIGGVPPFGHAQRLRVFVDPDLMVWDEVWAAAGTPRHVFALRPGELLAATGGTVVPLAAG
jgi:prolyl-tRNA editing enzyme YbaK/EbsC (Cys-tRNA(Pro) deacylase)